MHHKKVVYEHKHYFRHQNSLNHQKTKITQIYSNKLCMWGHNFHLGWRQIYLEVHNQPQDGIKYHEVNLYLDDSKSTI